MAEKTGKAMANDMEQENKRVKRIGHENKVDVLKEHLLRIVGKYSDYSRFELIIDNVIEEYDETLELYNFDICYGNSSGTLREKATEMLQVTVDIFRDLRDNAKYELYHVMCGIAELDESSQLEILGIVLERGSFTEVEFEEMLSDWLDYEWGQSAALESYLKVLKDWRILQENRGES